MSVGAREPLLRHILGDLLRRRRHEQKRTLADVATEAQISMPYLSEVERGLKEASSEVLAAVCRALGIGVGDLLAEATAEFALLRQPLVVTTITEPAPVGFAPQSGYGSVSLLAA
ncbi:helix-turn-helix domain-containing protein [Spongisporangium articulatum]|uniref:Helix-turn-helix domain-containing protein n=1 Tax=Spongisporangium articulatum TaxID=3362603 RepID=A0ABW8AS43_9ACTN